MSETATTVDPEEVAQFEALAAEWWDPTGPFKPLHEYGPVRVGFIRDQLCAHYDRDPIASAPLEGLSIVDIGCGGGLLCEPLSRLGANVTGIDPSEKNTGIANLHSEQMGLAINYRACDVETLASEGAQFDVVVSMEVLEHVADVPLFVDACAKVLKPGGLFLGATLNRTIKSLALAKVGVEYVLRWLPIGTHDWNKFLTPAEVSQALRGAGLSVTTLQGASYNPIKGTWAATSDDLDINYMVAAAKPAES